MRLLQFFSKGNILPPNKVCNKMLLEPVNQYQCYSAAAGHGLPPHGRDCSCITSTHMKQLCLTIEDKLFNNIDASCRRLRPPKMDKVEKEKQGLGGGDRREKNLNQTPSRMIHHFFISTHHKKQSSSKQICLGNT